MCPIGFLALPLNMSDMLNSDAPSSTSFDTGSSANLSSLPIEEEGAATSSPAIAVPPTGLDPSNSAPDRFDGDESAPLEPAQNEQTDSRDKNGNSEFMESLGLIVCPTGSGDETNDEVETGQSLLNVIASLIISGVAKIVPNLRL